MSITTQVHRQLDAVTNEWETLADRANATPFIRPGWIKAWCKYFHAGALEILTVHRDGRMIGLVPFCRRFGVLKSPTNHHTPAFSLVAEDQTATRYLVQALFTQLHDQISLAYLDEDSDPIAVLLATANDVREKIIVRTHQRSPYVALKGVDWPAYESSLNAKLKSDLRRRWRRLEQAGHVCFEIADGSRDLSNLLDEGFRIEPSGWKARRGTAISSASNTLLFYAEVARWAASRGELRLAFIRLDGRAIAFQLGLEHGRTYYFLKGGYDTAFLRFSPGKLLMREMLRHAFAGGLESFEFLGEEEPWKLEWTLTCRTRVNVRAFKRTLAGHAQWIAQKLGRPFVKRLLATYRSTSPLSHSNK